MLNFLIQSYILLTLFMPILKYSSCLYNFLHLINRYLQIFGSSSALCGFSCFLLVCLVPLSISVIWDQGLMFGGLYLLESCDPEAEAKSL